MEQVQVLEELPWVGMLILKDLRVAHLQDVVVPQLALLVIVFIMKLMQVVGYILKNL
jgi:hypothetical protein